MHILVTGSSGTIGTRLCERLLEGGHNVSGIDWVVNKWQPKIQELTTLMDMRDDAKVMAYEPKSQVDVMVHLAANARVYELVEEPRRALDNFVTLFNALELARKLNVKKFIFASSRESYGNIAADKYTEDLARVENCESPYTASKIGGEALVEAYTRCYGVDHIIVRFSNVYGMYDDSIRVVPLFIRMCRKNEAITVFGKDKCLDFTYIDDAVSGVILMIEKFDGAKNQTINLAYGEGTTLIHLAERVKQLLGSESEVKVGVPRIGEVVRYVADISKAKQFLGYDPKTAFDEGIEKAVDWYTKAGL